jgi:NADH-quinone oxidoreductase subunit M
MILVLVLLAERSGGSDDIRDMGGIAFRAPVLAALFLIATLATLAMPGSANFVGEFLILLGTFSAKMAVAFVASIGVILASVYALRLYIRAMHNRVGPAVTSYEMSLRDGIVLVPLLLCVIAFALYPQQALHHSERAVKAVMQPLQQAQNPTTTAKVTP